MNRINEIGDTVRGQEMLGRTAERAHQRAQRTSGADKQRHEKTEWDAYQTAAGNSRKHLDGSGAHFARGRDAEYDEHWDDGRYPWSKKHKSKNESKTMNKKLIRLTESDLHRIVKESVNRVLNEMRPETYASYAKGREAQGQMDKAQVGKQAAIDKWNSLYGDNYSQMNQDYSISYNNEKGVPTGMKATPMDDGSARSQRNIRH